MLTHIVPSPVPHTKATKINEMHEKGDRGGEKEVFLFSIGDRANSFFYSGCGRRLARGAKAT